MRSTAPLRDALVILVGSRQDKRLAEKMLAKSLHTQPDIPNKYSLLFIRHDLPQADLLRLDGILNHVVERGNQLIYKKNQGN